MSKEMNPFKVGDKVRHRHTGKIQIITSISENRMFIRFNGEATGDRWSPHVLAKPVKPVTLKTLMDKRKEKV